MKYFGQHCPACNGSLHRGLLVYQTNKCLTNPIVCNHYYCFKCLYGNRTTKKSRLISKFVHEGEVLVNVQCLPYIPPFSGLLLDPLVFFRFCGGAQRCKRDGDVIFFAMKSMLFICFFLYESVTYIYIYLPAQPAIIYKDTIHPPKIKNGCQATGTLYCFHSVQKTPSQTHNASSVLKRQM